ncbi:MAG: YndJ family transporter [Bryobacterales bacterium]|nr:YndJ family transporter [Bryobacterales bacterium]
MIALRFAVPFAALLLAPVGLWVAGVALRTIAMVLAAAIILTASLALEPGNAAVAAVIPFAAASAWAAWHNPPLRLPCLYLAAGSVALALSRGDLEIPFFPPAFLLLTAIHFYYAGFAASIFTARTATALGEQAATPWFGIPRLMVMGAPLALVPATVASRYLEAAVVFVQTLAITAIAGFALLATTGSRRPLRSLSLSIAAACAVIGMAASAIFAASRFGNLYWLPVPELGALHAVAMGVGFSLIGLLAWLEPVPAPAQLDHTRSGASSRVPS